MGDEHHAPQSSQGGRTSRPEIVENLSSPTLVRAGPGSGKTYLLGERLKWLLDNDHATSRQVTLLAYGRDAADNMLEKLTDPKGDFHLDRAALRGRVSTMHALGNKIISRAPQAFGLSEKYGVLEDKAVRKLLFRDACQNAGQDESCAREANVCKGQGCCNRDGRRPACKVCTAYDEIMRKCDHVDYDDQIQLACELLAKSPIVERKFQAGAMHLLVDEYQDINAAQRNLLKALSTHSPNGVFYIGDDAQSIYSFRGGNPAFILNIRDDYPMVREEPLKQSWRCHRNILASAAKVLMKHNAVDANPSDVEYKGEAAKLGPEPHVWQFYSMETEASAVAEVAAVFLRLKKDVLILVPDAKLYHPMASALRKVAVPFSGPASTVPGKTEERLLAASRLLGWVAAPLDNFKTRLVMEDLLDRGPVRVPGGDRSHSCNKETRDKRVCAERAVAKLWQAVSGNRKLYHVAKSSRGSHVTLNAMVDNMMKLRSAFAGKDKAQAGELALRLAALGGLWEDPEELARDISELRKATRPERALRPRRVLLTTTKKAKGLEAQVVIVPGVEAGLVPDPRNDKSEEARLFYVTMTRAKERLFLFHSARRQRKYTFRGNHEDRPRSSFLGDVGIASTPMNPERLQSELERFRTEVDQ